MTGRVITVVALSALIWTGAPAIASASDARLYEVTENMRLTSHGKFEHRKATSELIGIAEVGTPLCPVALIAAVSASAKTCTINATGSDNISLATGRGDFGGTFTVVVQGDNPTDSPELVVMKGTFRGKMDFSPAVRFGIPLGYVSGKVSDGRGSTFPFTGTFRLPFVLRALPIPDGAGGTVSIPCGPSLPCDTVAFGGAPTPLDPMSNYDLVAATRPLYLMDDLATIVPLKSDEFGYGWAMVKFEISF
jgi:hypothetical protein